VGVLTCKPVALFIRRRACSSLATEERFIRGAVLTLGSVAETAKVPSEGSVALGPPLLLAGLCIFQGRQPPPTSVWKNELRGLDQSGGLESQASIELIN
jgi:hypothetical protein